MELMDESAEERSEGKNKNFVGRAKVFLLLKKLNKYHDQHVAMMDENQQKTCKSILEELNYCTWRQRKSRDLDLLEVEHNRGY